MEHQLEAAVAAGLLPDGATAKEAESSTPRKIYLLQRKGGKHGAGLGRTTGWIHRASLKKLGVEMVGGVSYEKVRALGT